MLILLLQVLTDNQTVELLTATNCDITDTVGAAIAECLERNKCLKYLTLDSNNISGDMLVKLIRATTNTKTLEELRCSNQVNFFTYFSFVVVNFTRYSIKLVFFI